MALTLPKKLSLNIKIMGMVGLPMFLLLLTFVFIYERVVVDMTEDSNRIKHLADTIALNGAIDKQAKHLEKLITGVLNTSEIITFLANPQDQAAKNGAIRAVSLLGRKQYRPFHPLFSK